MVGKLKWEKEGAANSGNQRNGKNSGIANSGIECILSAESFNSRINITHLRVANNCGKNFCVLKGCRGWLQLNFQF